MKLFNLIVLLSLLPFTVIWGQEQEDTVGCVVFVDSVPQGASFARHSSGNFHKQRVKRRSPNLSTVASREGKMIASYDSDELDEDDEILHCVRMAMDLWESYLICIKPIEFYVGFDEDISPDVEIRTIVNYLGKARTAIPYSLYHQSYNIPQRADSILINADVDWDYSWAYYSANGNDNLTTSMIRHIGHILGFGTTIVPSGASFQVAVRRTASIYDKMLKDSQGHSMESFLVEENSDSICNFLKRSLHLELPSGEQYQIYSQASSYVPFRSGNYFSLSQDNVMNYPYADTSRLMVINEETLDVLEAIGWPLLPYGVKIGCSDLDDAGYGSGYDSHTYVAVSESGDTLQQVSWRYQKFSNSTGGYVDVSVGSGSSFTVGAQSILADVTDDFHCLQGRVLCSYQGCEYAKPVFLELRPGVVSIDVQNMQTPSAGYISFDVNISCFGASSGQLTAANSSGWSLTKVFQGAGSSLVHFDNVPVYGENYVMVVLGNSYGYCMKSIALTTGNNNLRLSQPANENQGISVKINGKDTEDLAVLHDGDAVYLKLADVAVTSADEVRWQFALAQSDGGWWTSSIDGSYAENSFVVRPSVFFEKPSGEVNKFLACEVDDETGVVYNTGYINALVYQDGELICSREHPVRFEILPSMPVVKMVRCWYEHNSWEMWPVAELEIDRAFNYDVGWIDITDGEWYGTIGGVFESDTPMPHREIAYWGYMGCMFRVGLGNDYGVTQSSFLYPDNPPTSIVQPAIGGMSIASREGGSILEFPEPVERVSIQSLSGRTVAVGKNLQRMQITAKAGIYLVRVSKGNEESVFKITIK